MKRLFSVVALVLTMVAVHLTPVPIYAGGGTVDDVYVYRASLNQPIRITAQEIVFDNTTSVYMQFGAIKFTEVGTFDNAQIVTRTFSSTGFDQFRSRDFLNRLPSQITYKREGSNIPFVSTSWKTSCGVGPTLGVVYKSNNLTYPTVINTTGQALYIKISDNNAEYNFVPMFAGDLPEMTNLSGDMTFYNKSQVTRPPGGETEICGTVKWDWNLIKPVTIDFRRTFFPFIWP